MDLILLFVKWFGQYRRDYAIAKQLRAGWRKERRERKEMKRRIRAKKKEEPVSPITPRFWS
jgi:hypothetical protein